MSEKAPAISYENMSPARLAEVYADSKINGDTMQASEVLLEADSRFKMHAEKHNWTEEETERVYGKFIDRARQFAERAGFDVDDLAVDSFAPEREVADNLEGLTLLKSEETTDNLDSLTLTELAREYAESETSGDDEQASVLLAEVDKRYDHDAKERGWTDDIKAAMYGRFMDQATYFSEQIEADNLTGLESVAVKGGEDDNLSDLNPLVSGGEKVDSLSDLDPLTPGEDVDDLHDLDPLAAEGTIDDLHDLAPLSAAEKVDDLSDLAPLDTEDGADKLEDLAALHQQKSWWRRTGEYLKYQAPLGVYSAFGRARAFLKKQEQRTGESDEDFAERRRKNRGAKAAIGIVAVGAIVWWQQQGGDTGDIDKGFTPFDPDRDGGSSGDGRELLPLDPNAEQGPHAGQESMPGNEGQEDMPTLDDNVESDSGSGDTEVDHGDDHEADGGAAMPEFSEAAHDVFRGEGWHQTFEDMGIPYDEWHSLLHRVGPELEKLGWAYPMEWEGQPSWGISQPGELPQDVLEYIWNNR